MFGLVQPDKVKVGQRIKELKDEMSLSYRIRESIRFKKADDQLLRSRLCVGSYECDQPII